MNPVTQALDVLQERQNRRTKLHLSFGAAMKSTPRTNDVVEEWKTISEFPQYLVSSAGRIRNKVTGSDLTLRRNRKGYLGAELWRDGKRGKRIVSRLVCAAFNGPPPFAGAQAAHLDGTKDNNVPSNLEWTSCKENNSHRAKHGTLMVGERNHRCVLTARDVEEIVAALQRGEKSASIARRYEVGAQAIYHIKNGHSWGWLTGISPVNNSHRRSAGSAEQAPASNR